MENIKPIQSWPHLCECKGSDQKQIENLLKPFVKQSFIRTIDHLRPKLATFSGWTIFQNHFSIIRNSRRQQP